MAVLSAALLGCYMPVVDNNDVERARRTSPLTYKNFTPVTSYPKTFETPEHREAIKNYSTIRDCLIESEALSDFPDLRLVDWSRIHKKAELDLCLWRIFSSLDDFESIIQWMDFHYLASGQRYPSEIKSVEDLIFFKDSGVYWGGFYWHKTLPFQDENPVPRYALGSFKIELSFRQSDNQLIRVSSSWQTTM